jgi:hypothetical protein
MNIIGKIRSANMLNDDLDIGNSLKEINLQEKYRAIVLELSAYVNPILSFIPRSMPSYTDHGLRHSNNILKLLAKFQANLSKVSPPFSFSQEELLLLTLSAYLHDIGCIIKRERHNEHSAKLLMEDPVFANLQDKLGAEMLRCLKFIVLSHSSNYDLSKVATLKISPNVRIGLICAVFRLLDACEISAVRTSKILFDILNRNAKMGDDEKKYWESHLNIINIFFENNEIIIDCEDIEKTKISLNHLREDLEKINEVLRQYNLVTFTIKIVNIGFQ